MIYEQNINYCLAKSIGSGGLDSSELNYLLEKLDPEFERLKKSYLSDNLPILTLPEVDDLSELSHIATVWRKKFDKVIILGAGGSSLGGKTLCALNQDEYGTAPGAPRIYFFENVDPFGFDRAMSSLDLSRTGLIVISKSGNTAETLVQLLCCISAWRAAGFKDLSESFLAICGPGNNILRRICLRENIQILDHDPLIGGRYSVLSKVGMLPALIAGLDCTKLRRGASEILNPILQGAKPSEFGPAIGAAISVGLSRNNGISQSVMMPYIDRLMVFSKWYRQLWAESLGKKGLGTTPIDALGVVDQHSQLQLYLDGPRDKMFTILMLDQKGVGMQIDPSPADAVELNYVVGRTMGDLINAEQRATAQTLIDSGLPTRIISFKELDEKTLGGLLMFFMLETILAASLLRIDPFDQPAVARGKLLTQRYLADFELL